jgi:hypothetical protein
MGDPEEIVGDHRSGADQILKQNYTGIWVKKVTVTIILPIILPAPSKRRSLAL